jgi:hypothetical protein
MSDPREAIATALSGFLTPEQSKILVDEVLTITKQMRCEFKCKKCGASQVQYGHISDARAVAGALTDLANQAYGRPTESSVQNDPIKFIRLTHMAELDDHKQGSKPNRSVPRNSKVRKGEVRRQSGSPSRRKTTVDKPADG